MTKFLSNWGAMRKDSFSPLWAVELVFENMKVPFLGLDDSMIVTMRLTKR